MLAAEVGDEPRSSVNAVSCRSSRPGFSVIGWLLRHPADHDFRQARAAVSDPWLSGHLDEWISAADPSYSALAAQDWSAEEDGADLVVEVQLRDPVPLDCKEPAPAGAVTSHRSSASSAQNCGYARSKIPTRVCGSGTADAGRAAALARASEIIGSTCCARRPGEA